MLKLNTQESIIPGLIPRLNMHPLRHKLLIKTRQYMYIHMAHLRHCTKKNLQRHAFSWWPIFFLDLWHGFHVSQLEGTAFNKCSFISYRARVRAEERITSILKAFHHHWGHNGASNLMAFILFCSQSNHPAPPTPYESSFQCQRMVRQSKRTKG